MSCFTLPDQPDCCFATGRDHGQPSQRPFNLPRSCRFSVVFGSPHKTPQSRYDNTAPIAAHLPLPLIPEP